MLRVSVSGPSSTLLADTSAAIQGVEPKLLNICEATFPNFEYALVVLDRVGCGAAAPRKEIQHAVEHDLSANGWRDRSKAIVIDPELETWIWNG